MTNPVDESFVFEVVDFSFLDKGEWTFTNEPELRVFGQLVRGNITKGDSILVTTVDGLATGVVVQFMDSLDDWLGLPFYNRVRPDSIPFCLVIMGISSDSVPLCPSTAHFAAPEPLVPDILTVEYPDEHCGEFRF